jgi:shikimate kinase
LVDDVFRITMGNTLIVITGFMGSGKSAVASALSRHFEREVIDLDETIAEVEGRSARQLIDEGGEGSFREIETRVLERLLANSTTGIIALGGGAWTIPRNRDLINQHGGISVWLDAPFDLCWKRIVASGDERPLARDEQEARELYERRLPHYKSAELQIVASEDKPIEEIVEEIVQALLRRPGEHD